MDSGDESVETWPVARRDTDFPQIWRPFMAPNVWNIRFVGVSYVGYPVVFSPY